MKALSGYAEWFYLLATNVKRVENRPWDLHRYLKPDRLPARIYLHASKTKTPADEMAFIRRTLTPEEALVFDAVDFEALRGKLIATITVERQVTKMNDRWFFGPFGFIMSNGCLLTNPIPYRGQLGFFEVKI